MEEEWWAQETTELKQPEIQEEEKAEQELNEIKGAEGRYHEPREQKVGRLLALPDPGNSQTLEIVVVAEEQEQEEAEPPPLAEMPEALIEVGSEPKTTHAGVQLAAA